ncbi:hypothetical protein ACRS6Y_18170 [Bacillus cytotoxicus]|uniref:A0A073K6Z9 (Uncharacterized protein) n=1 Tax=Bacillus cytotoxicus TaxID=580165 RepID=A0AAX2CMA0_9BACI|nr:MULTISPECIES: hypothetical protein [Bacillus cereus group]AWC30272.1 hypothetical protein CG483_019240 [Bacillus cytotoxicus]AWC34324.1 hypothetical protein CG482_019230 [Bacillus cytotoxicus]AWC38323.1 hypothetical protein CG481_019080 [Bacillus cytotoxicus]AWC42412.1 hypothetical protein CG480_019260 [Bacillus cytotoxicus]AWC46297.1 hypothetical protein CG479_018420 [Bacillus cytotoxicus]
MKKRWTNFAFLSTSNTIILDGEMTLSHLFDQSDDETSSTFTMRWCKWGEHCNLEEGTPNQEQRIIFTNPIKAWIVQYQKCNVKNHLKKTEPRQFSSDTPILELHESNN